MCHIGLIIADIYILSIGTIQAFVENGYVETYKEEIEKVFGKGSCHILKVRKLGGCKVID